MGTRHLYHIEVSTHSRPKAAGTKVRGALKTTLFQHTAARRRLDTTMPPNTGADVFQHTAARRRLAIATPKSCSTH